MKYIMLMKIQCGVMARCLLHLLWALGALLVMPGSVQAAPFASCSNLAYLVQGSPAAMFSLNLSTGAVNLETDNMGTNNKVNALGFNPNDNYFYAWSRQFNTVVRIGDDFQIEPLVIANKPNVNFYVGDVSTTENAYYMYRKGSATGHSLWRVSLDPNDAQYLQAVAIIDGATTNLNIFDFAFHPSNSYIYAVAKDGTLHRIDLLTGLETTLGNVGETGTFGANYFDSDGNMYISRNKDGHVFKIDLSAPTPTAVLFSFGPSSSNNDGARCSNAPITVEPTDSLDFGDAPSSYGTSLADNGPRHIIADNNPLLIGTNIDSDPDAHMYPDSDDAFGTDDEDGISFVTDVSGGNNSIVDITVDGNGFLSSWIDFDGNGIFDVDEQIITDAAVSTGTSSYVFAVPSDAIPGTTWMRTRVSTLAGLLPLGGAPDGEVEDESISIINPEVTQSFYPAAGQFVSLAYEDLWPSVGDYDMNDLVVYYQTALTETSNGVESITISGRITAVGASFHSGFAVQIPSLVRSDVDQSGLELEINGQLQSTHSLLEEGQSKPVLVVTEDIWDVVVEPEGCNFFRTQGENFGICGSGNIDFGFRIYVPLVTAKDKSIFNDQLFDPFIFATDGYPRNSYLSNPGRGLEIHLKNKAPTDLADMSLFGRGDDKSDPSQNLYYQNASGLPWAIEVGTEWLHLYEANDLILGYPSFIDYVLSGGQTNMDWYIEAHAVEQYLYKD